MRFEPGAPYPETVKTIAHVAFEVDNLEEELEGKNVIIKPNSANVTDLPDLVPEKSWVDLKDLFLE